MNSNNNKNTAHSSPTAILGISAYYHDAAAALVLDGHIVAASQQERYSRKKHDPAFPVDAINFCLTQADLELETLSAVVFYDKPLLKFERLLETYLANAPMGYRSFVRSMPIWLKEKLYLKKVLRDELANIVYQKHAHQHSVSITEAKNALKKKLKLPQLLFCEHHQSHAAAAYFPSPYNQATVVCLDGVGEWATSSIWKAQGGELTPISEIQFPHSLGLLYSAFTQYCGFKVNTGEYKLMGLAPYGEPKYVELIYQHLIDVNPDGSFTLDMQYFDFAVGHTMTNKAFHELFGAPAYPLEGELTQKQMDLAKSIQVVTEEIVLKIVNTAYQQNPCDNLCLAGGVALNCVANGRILKEGPFENLWIQPASGDAGSALGAALQVWHQYFENDKKPLIHYNDTSKRHSNKTADVKAKDSGSYKNEHAASTTDHSCRHKNLANQDNSFDKDENQPVDYMQGAYLGDSFSNEEVIAACQKDHLVYTQLSDEALFSKVAKLLTQDKVVGWFQDKMEFGPRALGNRSILGDARSQTMQTQMNIKIKQRESFRPFAPAVLEEDLEQYFELSTPSPYMLLTAPVNHAIRHQVTSATGLEKLAQMRSHLPAITHVDYSARVQTISPNTNPKFYKLVSEFKSLTGVGVIINTSFNVRGEPPVRSPQDAIRSFLATEMDVLVMQNCMLDKQDQPQAAIDKAKEVTFEKD